MEQLTADDWTPYGPSFYKAGVSSVTWDEARTGCPQMHHRAYLASVHSDGEQQFLANQFAKPYGVVWIGLNDIKDEGHFTWINGDAVNFTYWSHGQPDDQGAVQDCTVIKPDYSYMWDDDTCKASFMFVCKIDP